VPLPVLIKAGISEEGPEYNFEVKNNTKNIHEMIEGKVKYIDAPGR
jgi:hypothetical protein